MWPFTASTSLQRANWVIERGPVAPLGATPASYGEKTGGVSMTEPAGKAKDTLEADVDAAIAVCESMCARHWLAALVYNDFLERRLDTMRGMVSSGYTRGKISPERAASEKLDERRETDRLTAAE
jgi:hypothetical protein